MTIKEHKLAKQSPHTASFFCELENIDKGPSKYTKQYTYTSQGETLNFTGLRRGTITNYKRDDTFDLLDEIIDSGLPFDKLEYKPAGQRPVSVVHLGQLKLFLSTFQFLLEYSQPNRTTHIVYPGSAPGSNIDLLTKLFPNTLWYLFDPRDFDKRLKSNKHVKEIKNDLFRNEDAIRLSEDLKDEHVLLISDIRNCTDMIDERKEFFVFDNQELQRAWVELLKPSYAQLKFRMPRLDEIVKSNKYNYLDGKIYLQMFPRIDSAETRLVVNGRDIHYKDYNVRMYEGAMYYYNRKLRTSWYECKNHDKRFDHCHDCIKTLKLLDKYKDLYITDSLEVLVDVVFKEIPSIYSKLKYSISKVRNELG